jgi:hypothetical protein
MGRWPHSAGIASIRVRYLCTCPGVKLMFHGGHLRRWVVRQHPDAIAAFCRELVPSYRLIERATFWLLGMTGKRPLGGRHPGQSLQGHDGTTSFSAGGAMTLLRNRTHYKPAKAWIKQFVPGWNECDAAKLVVFHAPTKGNDQ